MEGCYEMGKTLLNNRTITELDLTSNRISLDAFRQLLPGVGKNKTLKILRVSHWQSNYFFNIKIEMIDIIICADNQRRSASRVLKI